MELTLLFDIGANSDEFSEIPQIQFDKRDALLIYEYESPSGGFKNRAIRFVDTLMCKRTRDEIKESWHHQAYDHVAMVVDSKMLQEIQQRRPITQYGRNTAEYHHYIVCFDEMGVYEFIAKDAMYDFIET